MTKTITRKTITKRTLKPTIKAKVGKKLAVRKTTTKR